MKHMTIFILLLTVLFSGLSQGLTLTPELLNDLYCFDSSQVRFIAREIHQSPIKDSLIKEQDSKISNLSQKNLIKDKIIDSQNHIIENDSLAMSLMRENLELKDEESELKVKQEKIKSKKLKLILIAESVLLFIILIIK